MSIRITAGNLKGRGIQVDPHVDLRPTTGYGRQMIFNILGSAVSDSFFLDLYAGSGAVGFEAASRGAARVVFVEESQVNAESISINIERLGLGNICNVLCADAANPQSLGLDNMMFDIIFLDPPYAFFPIPGFTETSSLLKGQGVLICEHSSRNNMETPIGLKRIDYRKAGDSAYGFYKKLKGT